jgi:hypothetical protein
MPELCRQIAVSNESMTSNIVNAINNAMQELADKMEQNAKKTTDTLTLFKTAITTSLKTVILSLEDMETESTCPPTTVPVEESTMLTTPEQQVPDLTIIENTPPTFQQVVCSSISTVTEVLEEWENGLNGKPSILFMEAQWKTKWHVGSQNQKIFSRRKIIENMIYNYA